MNSRLLPSWADCEIAVDNSEASPLEVFVYELEPCNPVECSIFRTELARAMNHESSDLEKWGSDHDDFNELHAQLVSYATAFKTGSPDIEWVSK